jgi:hypothetical protein
MSAYTPSTKKNITPQPVYWGAAVAGEASRRQSTTPQNALDRLPNQRPVQVFNSPGLYGIPPDSWAHLKESPQKREGFATTYCAPRPNDGLWESIKKWFGM